MKKILKTAGIAVFGIVILLYAAFLFVLPKCIDLSRYKADVQKIVKDEARLDLDFDNIRLITSPSLAIGVKADNITVKLPDNSLLFSSDSIKTAVSIPQLLLFNIKIPFLKIENPLLNAEIMQNGEDYKIVKLIEDIINDKKAASFAVKPEPEESKSGFDLNSFKITAPNILLNNYKVIIADLSSKHYIDVKGEKLVFGWFNGRRIRVKTAAELFSDENKNASFNIDINTFIPEAEHKLDSEDDPAEKIDIAFINPVETYRKYDLKAVIDAKLKINQNKDGAVTSYGRFNAENITMKISDIRIPESWFRLKTFGSTIEAESDLYTHENENLKIKGKLNYGNRPNADIKLKTEGIKFANLLEIYKALLDSMQLPNEIGRYKAEGSASADCELKTNFKKLKSKGFIKAENGGLYVKNQGKVLSGININLILDDNSLDIKDSELYIGSSPVKINGKIDKKSSADISVNAENIPLPMLFNAFASKEAKKLYDFKSGELSSRLKIQGRLKEAQASADIIVENLDLADKKKSITAKNPMLSLSLNCSADGKISGQLINNGLQLIFPETKSVIKIPQIISSIQNKNIDLNQNLIYFNDKSVLLYSGFIKNYENLDNIEFNLNGEVNTDDIIKFIGNETKTFFNSKGSLPLNIKLSGNRNKQTLSAQVLSDDKAYITPVDFKTMQNLKASLQTEIDFKPGRIKIKDTGLFTRASIYNDSGKETVITHKIIGAEGTIENDTINLIKIDIPNRLEGKISVFPDSSFKIEDGIIYIYGKLKEPLFKGHFKIKDINLPEILTALNSADFEFKTDEMHFNLDKIMLSKSDLDIKGKLSLKPSVSAVIYDFIVNSNSFSAEDAVLAAQKASKFAPESKKTETAQNIPLYVRNGKISMKKIKAGNIELKDTKADMTVQNNILSLKNLSSGVFNGRTEGSVLVNLVSMLIKTDLKGSDINTAKMLSDAAGLKDTLSGNASYNAALIINGAASSPEEQIKGIKGSVDFAVHNGQFGPFGRLENLILAENIRESEFFKTALGGVINSLATIDTTHFSELKGRVSFDEGICTLEPVTSEGNVMNLHILGKFDIIKNYADMKARVKLTSIVSNMLGPINAVNPINLISSAAGLNAAAAKAFSLFCEVVPEEEMNIMPKFSNAYVDSSASKFQLGIRGDAAKPLTLIKSFKWLTVQSDFDKAEQFAASLPEPAEGFENESAADALKRAQKLEAEKKTLKYKIKHIFDKEDKEEGAETN